MVVTIQTFVVSYPGESGSRIRGHKDIGGVETRAEHGVIANRVGRMEPDIGGPRSKIYVREEEI